MGLAFGGSAAVTLFCTMCVENSASVAFAARWSTMTWFRASGAMVATYWSVLVTVRMAQTEITEMGMSSDARTTSTQALIRLARWRDAGFAASAVGVSCAARCRRERVASGVSSESMSFIWARSPPNA